MTDFLSNNNKSSHEKKGKVNHQSLSFQTLCILFLFPERMETRQLLHSKLPCKYTHKHTPPIPSKEKHPFVFLPSVLFTCSWT